MSRYRVAVDVGGTFTDIFVFEEEVCHYELDLEATKREREWIRERRLGWLEEDPGESGSGFCATRSTSSMRSGHG